MPRPIPPDVTPPAILGACGCGCEGEQCRIDTDSIGYTTTTPASGESQTLTVENRDAEIPCGKDYYHWSCNKGSFNQETGLSVIYTAPASGSATIYLHAKCPDHPETWEGILVDTLTITVGDCNCGPFHTILLDGHHSLWGPMEVDARAEPYPLTISGKDPTLPCDLEYGWRWGWFKDSYVSPIAGASANFYAPTGGDEGTIHLRCKGLNVDSLDVVVKDPDSCACTGNEEINGDTRITFGNEKTYTIDNVSPTDPCDIRYTWTITSDDIDLFAELSFKDNIATGQEVTIKHQGSHSGTFTIHLRCKAIEYDTLDVDVTDCSCTNDEEIIGNEHIQPNRAMDLSLSGKHGTFPCDMEYEWRVNPAYNPGGECYIQGVGAGNEAVFVSGVTFGLAVVEVRCKLGNWGDSGVLSIWIADCMCYTDDITPSGPLDLGKNSSVFLQVNPNTDHPDLPCDEDYEWEVDSGPADCYVLPSYGWDTRFYSAETVGTAVVTLYCKRDENPGYRDSVTINITVCCGKAHIEGPTKIGSEGYGIFEVVPNPGKSLCPGYYYTWEIRQTNTDAYLADSTGIEATLVAGKDKETITLDLYCDGAPEDDFTVVVGCGSVGIVVNPNDVVRYWHSVPWFRRSKSLRLSLAGPYGTCTPSRYSWSENHESAYISGTGTSVTLQGGGCAGNGVVTVRLDGSVESTLEFYTYGGYDVVIVGWAHRGNGMIDIWMQVKLEGTSTYVTNLSQGAFDVYLNSNPASIYEFTRPTGGYMSASIMMDFSGSMVSDIALAKAAACAFVDNMTGSDEANVIKFGGLRQGSTGCTWSVKSPWGTNKTTLKSDINYNDPVTGYTPIYNVVYQRASDVTTRDGNICMGLLYTDGADTCSDKTLSQAIDRFNQQKSQTGANHNAVMTIVGLGSEVPKSEMTQLATLTGGQYYHVINTAQMGDLFEALAKQKNCYHVRVGSPYTSGSIEVRAEYTSGCDKSGYATTDYEIEYSGDPWNTRTYACTSVSCNCGVQSDCSKACDGAWSTGSGNYAATACMLNEGVRFTFGGLSSLSYSSIVQVTWRVKMSTPRCFRDYYFAIGGGGSPGSPTTVPYYIPARTDSSPTEYYVVRETKTGGGALTRTDCMYLNVYKTNDYFHPDLSNLNVWEASVTVGYTI